MRSEPKPEWIRWAPRLAGACVAFSVAVGLYLRWSRAGRALLYGDEFPSLIFRAKPLSEVVSTYDAYGSGLALPLLQRLSVGWIGDSLVAYRMPALLAGSATLLVLYPILTRWLDRRSAACATILMALSSSHTFYSHFGRSYALAGIAVLGFAAAAHRITQPAHMDGAGSAESGESAECTESTERGGPSQAPTVARRAPSWVHAGLALSAAVALWAHLSSAPVLAAIALAGLVRIRMAERDRSTAIGFIAGLTAGAVLTALAYAPALDSTLAFLESTASSRRLGISPVAVLSVLSGTQASGVLLAAATTMGALMLWRRDRLNAPILVFPVVAPLLFFAAVQPAGAVYAYARYSLVALPFALALSSWALLTTLDAVIDRFLPNAQRRHGTLLSLCAAVLVVTALGAPSLVRSAISVRGFENTYASLYPLPAFDRPYADAPDFYRAVARDQRATRVIEVPQLRIRSQLFYRALAALHGKEVFYGYLDANPALVPGGPYGTLLDPDFAERSQADYLILHRDISKELSDYWAFVYAGIQEADRSRPFMKAMREPAGGFPRVAPDLARRAQETLATQLGAPFYEDEHLMAWKLR